MPIPITKIFQKPVTIIPTIIGIVNTNAIHSLLTDFI